MGLFDRRQRGKLTRYSTERGERLLESLTGAASPVTQQTNENLRSLHQPWQSLAFGYYAKVGECWNPAQFYARSMSKLDVLVGEVQDDGEVIPTENQQVIDLFEPIRRYAKGEGGLLASYGRLKFLIGEGRLTQSRPPESQEPNSASLPPVWEFLSPTELALTDEGRTIVRKEATQGQGVSYVNISNMDGAGDPEPGQMRMWRFWRRHPEFSMQADSPVRAVLDLYEQLWWVTMGERADIQSRIANTGVLLIPSEIDLTPKEGEDEATEEDPEADPFTIRIGDAMMTAIGDPGSASAVVPPVIRAPADMLHPDRFRHLQFYDPSASMFATQREAALINRVGIGLDMPLELLTGTGGMNHWGTWHLDDEKWAHVEPVATSWCDDVHGAVFGPLLQANGIDDPERYPIIFDNTDLVTDPDKGKTAIVLHKDGMLKAEVTLEANGFDADNLMDEDEKLEWLAIQLNDPTLVGGAAPASDAIPNEQEPDTEDQQDDGAEADEPPALAAARLHGAAEFAVERAREMAGAKVRALKRSCEDCFVGMDDVHNRDLCAALGREMLERLKAPTPAALVNGVANTFLAACAQMGLPTSEQQAANVCRYAAATLFDVNRRPIPDDLLSR